VGVFFVHLIEIPYEPVPWSAPRLSKFRCYDPREKDKRAIRYLVKEQYKDPMIEGYVNIVFMFGFSIPKSTSKKNAAKMLAQEIIPTRCDCTNLQKLFEDCLKGIVFKDDRLVETISTKKIYAPKPFMMALIWTKKERQEGSFSKDLERIIKCA